MSDTIQKKPSLLKYLLVVLEIVAFFVLSVYGNKLAEILKVSPKIIVGCTVALLVLCIGVKIALTRQESGLAPVALPHPGKVIPPILDKLVIVPLGFAFGLTCVFITINWFSQGSVPIANLTNIWSYEIASFLIALVGLYFIYSRSLQRLLVVLFAVGSAIGIAGALLALRPYQNSAIYTLGGWTLTLIISSFAISSKIFKAFVDRCSTLLQPKSNSEG
jgi:hypothetical protein